MLILGDISSMITDDFTYLKLLENAWSALLSLKSTSFPRGGGGVAAQSQDVRLGGSLVGDLLGNPPAPHKTFLVPQSPNSVSLSPFLKTTLLVWTPGS